jgi:hypothetical protein
MDSASSDTPRQPRVRGGFGIAASGSPCGAGLQAEVAHHQTFGYWDCAGLPSLRWPRAERSTDSHSWPKRSAIRPIRQPRCSPIEAVWVVLTFTA